LSDRDFEPESSQGNHR